MLEKSKFYRGGRGQSYVKYYVLLAEICYLDALAFRIYMPNLMCEDSMQ